MGVILLVISKLATDSSFSAQIEAAVQMMLSLLHLSPLSPKFTAVPPSVTDLRTVQKCNRHELSTAVPRPTSTHWNYGTMSAGVCTPIENNRSILPHASVCVGL